MMQNNSFNLTDSDIFSVEQSSKELKPQKKNAPDILNSTELSGAAAIEHKTLSSVASPEPQFIAILSDSNEPTIPYEYGRQDPILPTNLNDLNLPANPFNILATMDVVIRLQQLIMTITTPSRRIRQNRLLSRRLR